MSAWGGGEAMFGQLRTILSKRIMNAERCLRDAQHVTNDDEYRGKIRGLKDALIDVDFIERVWSGSGEEL